MNPSLGWGAIASTHKRTVFSFAMLAGIATAGYTIVDTYVLNHRITAEGDTFLASCAYLIIGGWLGVMLGIVLAQLLGARLIDSDFTGFYRPSREFLVLALKMGVVSALATLLHLWSLQFADPSVVTALAALAIPASIFYDRKKDQHAKKKFIPLVLVIVAGCVLSAYDGGFSISKEAFALLAISAFGYAYNGNLFQDAARMTDSVTAHLWRFLVLAASGTVMVAAWVTIVQGEQDALWKAIRHAVNLTTLGVAILSMGFVFVAIPMEGNALKPKATPMSYIRTVILAVSIMIAIPATLLLDQASEGLLGDVPSDLGLWCIRLLGVSITLAGVFAIARKQPETE